MSTSVWTQSAALSYSATVTSPCPCRSATPRTAATLTPSPPSLWRCTGVDTSTPTLSTWADTSLLVSFYSLTPPTPFTLLTPLTPLTPVCDVWLCCRADVPRRQRVQWRREAVQQHHPETETILPAERSDVRRGEVGLLPVPQPRLLLLPGPRRVRAQPGVQWGAAGGAALQHLPLPLCDLPQGLWRQTGLSTRQEHQPE